MDGHPLAEAWGTQIQECRKRDGQTRAEFAKRLGVTRQMVRLWEEGVHAPGPKMQSHLIALLGIDPVAVARLIQQTQKANGTGPEAA